MFKRIFAAAIVAASPVHADQVTLICSGVTQSSDKDSREIPVSMGVIIDLTARTLQADQIGIIPITSIEPNKIVFLQHGPHPDGLWNHVYGHMDRVTGDLFVANTPFNNAFSYDSVTYA